jgi:hypothetical protein
MTASALHHQLVTSIADVTAVAAEQNPLLVTASTLRHQLCSHQTQPEGQLA